MAELDWRIPLSGESPKINTPFENLNLVLQTKANQQKLKANDLELRQQTQDAEDRDAIRQIAQQYGNDPETMLTEITKRNPVLGMKMRSDIQDQTIKGLTIDITKRKLHADTIDEHLTGLLSVRKGDDAAWQRQRAATMQEDAQVGSELPEHLLTDEDVTQRNAVAMKGMNARAILIKDLEEQNRIRDDARAAADLQRKADEDAARQNRADRTAERMEAAQQATATYQARTADAADRRAGAAEARAAQAAKGPSLSPTAESNIINRLSNQWSQASKMATDLDRADNLMDAGLAAARRGDMAAGSQAVLVTFQKILDPTSVVRESEYMRSAAGQSLLNRVKGAYDNLVVGGAKVPLPELEKFARLAKEATQAQKVGLISVRERIGKTADRYSIPRELVLDARGGGDEPPPAAQPAQGGATPQRRQIKGGGVAELRDGKWVRVQ